MGKNKTAIYMQASFLGSKQTAIKSINTSPVDWINGWAGIENN